MEKIDSETLYDVLNIANIYGHPNEQKMSEEIKKRYLSAEDLEFNDLVNLDSLYKSNYEKFQKKVDDNE